MWLKDREPEKMACFKLGKFGNEELEENDFNLNIPRYVDTFEEEEEIDIQAVMADIKKLESERAELDKQINVYLKELGIIKEN